MIYLNDIPLNTFLKYFNKDNLSKNDSKYEIIYDDVVSSWYVQKFVNVNKTAASYNNKTTNIFSYTGYPLYTNSEPINSDIAQVLMVQTYDTGGHIIYSGPTDSNKPTDSSITYYSNVKSKMYKTPLYGLDKIDIFKYIPSKYSCKKIKEYEAPNTSVVVENMYGNNQEVDISENNTMLIYEFHHMIYPVFDTDAKTVTLYDFTDIDNLDALLKNITSSELGIDINEYLHEMLTDEILVNHRIISNCSYKELTDTDAVYYDVKYKNNYDDNDTRQYKQYGLYSVDGTLICILYENIPYRLPTYVLQNNKTYIKMLNTSINKEVFVDVNDVPQSHFSEYVTMLNAYKNISNQEYLGDTSVLSYLSSEIFKNYTLIYVDSGNSYNVYIKVPVTLTATQTKVDNVKYTEYSKYKFINKNYANGSSDDIILIDCTDIVKNNYGIEINNDIKNIIAGEIENTVAGMIVTNNMDLGADSNSIMYYRDINNPNYFFTVTTEYTIDNTETLINNLVLPTILSKESFINYSKTNNVCCYTAAAITDIRGNEIVSDSKALDHNAMRLVAIHSLANQSNNRYNNTNTLDGNFIFKQYVYNLGIKNMYTGIYNKMYKQNSINYGGQYSDIYGNSYFGFQKINDIYISHDVSGNMPETNNEDDVISTIDITDVTISDDAILKSDNSNVYSRLTEYETYQLNIDRYNDIKTQLLNKSITAMTEASTIVPSEIVRNTTDISFAKKYNNILDVIDNYKNFYIELYNVTSNINSNTTVNNDNLNNVFKSYISSYANNLHHILNDSNNKFTLTYDKLLHDRYKILYNKPITKIGSSYEYNASDDNSNLEIFKKVILAKN